MNPIEDEWLHLKRDELSSGVFEDKYLVAMALIAGIEARAVPCGYSR
jgi:putative transposase